MKPHTMPPRLLLLVTTLVLPALVALPSREASAQPPGAPWFARVWEVDAQTVLTLGATWGQEVRSGPGRTIRHGVRAPLRVEGGGDTVRFEVASGTDYAVRWIVRRRAQEVVIERWERHGADAGPWQRTRKLQRGL